MDKNLQELINYLEEIKKECEANTKVLIDGDVVKDFEEVISVNHVKNEINFLTLGNLY